MPTLKLVTKYSQNGVPVVQSGALNLRQDEYERLCASRRMFEEGSGPDRGVFTHFTEDGVPTKRLIVYRAIASMGECVSN